MILFRSRKRKRLFIALAIFLVAALILSSIFIIDLAKDRRKEREREELVRRYYAEKLEKYAEENERYADYEVDVAFLGDSLTDGYDLERYYGEFKVSNRAISGETTTGLEERLGVSVYDLKPKVVVMLIGANNMDGMLTNYESILLGLKENLPKTKIVILSLTAMGGEKWGRKNQLAAYNNVTLKKLAEKHGCYFVDLFTPMFDEALGEVYDGYTVDGGHLTELGYDVITALIKPTVAEALADYNGGESF